MLNKLRNALLYFMIFCITALIGVVIFDRFVMKIFVRHGQSKPIPAVTGITVDDAESIAEKYGFKLRINYEDHSDSVPEGYIISQIPKEGSMAKRGRTIKVIRSLGNEVIVVPDVTNMSVREAKIALQAAKLQVNNIEEIYHDEIMQDHVIETDPEPGDSLLAWSQIDLLISLGSRASEIVVPNFIGMEVEDIKELRSQLEIGVVFKYRPIPSIRENTVYQQSIEPGTMVPRGSVVTLLVSQGTSSSKPE